MSEAPSIIPVDGIARTIFVFRGRRVILDQDLAELYGVTTGALNQAVARNGARFPVDFAFRLDAEEWANLKSQSVIPSWGGRRSPPRAFTEHGALMAANVLRSPRAVQASIEVVRAFARLREILASHASLAGKLDELERRFDRRFAVVFKAIRKLMEHDEHHASRRIGFRPPES